MDNPFLKRATEHLREPAVFLGIVSPEPVRTFLGEAGKNGTLYERLILLRGTPGSGKTTLARLFDYASLATLLRNQDLASYRSLRAALTECGAINKDRPAVLSCRLNMETDYRNIWELPYQEDLRLGLTAALIEARAVLGWFDSLAKAGVLPHQIDVIPRSPDSAVFAAMGGNNVAQILEKAKRVESEMYNVVAALVSPAQEQLPKSLLAAYHPFDAIKEIRVKSDGDEQITLHPLVVLDDANVLHPDQLQLLERWLRRRELAIARWILSRLDILHLGKALEVLTEPPSGPDLPGVSADRETLEIMLQNVGESRLEYRTQFRKMARDMANRYLGQMPLFQARKLDTLSDLLVTEQTNLSAAKQKQLEEAADVTQRRLLISASRRNSIREEIRQYKPHGQELAADLSVAMEMILMHRYVNRVPQKTLFEGNEDPPPSRPLRANADVHEGARLQLLHRYDRPYYFGIDTLCDAGSENAEQFLHLAAILVEAMATRVIRSKPVPLDAKTQSELLREKASEIVRRWNFPECRRVYRLVEGIANRCLDRSLEPNGWLGAGANAFGVLQEDFQAIPTTSPELARIIQFGLAYNAFTLVPQYPCKGKTWCLMELGGLPALKYGLTLRRGGFVEGVVEDLTSMVKEE
jgi:hypothetical protein